MAYNPIESYVVEQAIADTSTTKKHELGTIVKAVDSTYGMGEFIYLLGVASTVIGSLVYYNATTYQTVLEPGSTDSTGVPLAVAMSANVAAGYGWYQISGNAVIKKAAVTVEPQVSVFVSATAGRITDVSSAGEQICGARTANLTTVTSTTSTVVVTINRPCRSVIA